MLEFLMVLVCLLSWCLMGNLSIRLIFKAMGIQERSDSFALGCLLGALVVPMFLFGVLVDLLLGLDSLKNNGKNSQSKKPKFERKTKTM